MDWPRKAKRATEFFILSVANIHSSLSAFHQATMIPARHLAYVFIKIGDVKTLRRVGCYRTAFNSVLAFFPKLSSSTMGKKAVACVSSGFGMSLFSPKKWDLMNCSFDIFLGWVDASALPKKVFTHLKAPPNSPAESLLKRFTLFDALFS